MQRFWRKSYLLWALPAATLGVLVACHHNKPTPPTGEPLVIGKPHQPGATGPRVLPPGVQIVWTKPPALGKPQPAIVALPKLIQEPVIRVRLSAPSDQEVAIPKTGYRGTLANSKTPNNKYVLLNTLPLEDYLAGVLPKEMPDRWAPAAYRAQAIAARTYATFQIFSRDPAAQWDVTADTSSQVYGGQKAETANSRAAVAATRGQVLVTTVTDKEGIFCTYFHSVTGGATVDPAEAWGDISVAPLSARTVGPVDAAAPKFQWPDISVSKADITRTMQVWGQRNSFPQLMALGNVQKVTIAKRNITTQRPTEIQLTDEKGYQAPIRAEEFRLALLQDPAGVAPKPPSSYFEIKDSGANIILTQGRGFGHGIGMSQWGAKALAEKGRSTAEILAFYYPASRLRTQWK